MSNISTHVLDTALGCPAAGIPAQLERLDGDTWCVLGSGVTNADGRIAGLLGEHLPAEGEHRISFVLRDYHEAQGTPGFFPRVTIDFEIRDAQAHHHVPLLLSPYSYSTYRGS
ncbi:MAG: 5-hydroxyisourate hydrolase [Myxococcota bacterium]